MTAQIQQIAIEATTAANAEQRRARRLQTARLWASDNREFIAIAAGIATAFASGIWFVFAACGR